MTDRQHARLRWWTAAAVEMAVGIMIFALAESWPSWAVTVVLVSAVVWAESIMTAAQTELRAPLASERSPRSPPC